MRRRVRVGARIFTYTAHEGHEIDEVRPYGLMIATISSFQSCLRVASSASLLRSVEPVFLLFCWFILVFDIIIYEKDAVFLLLRQFIVKFEPKGL